MSNNAYIDFLNKQGWDAINFSDEVQPLFMIVNKVPKVKKDGPAPNIEITKTNKLDSGAGLEIFKGLLSALMPSNLKISGEVNAAYTRASKMEIIYEHVLADAVDDIIKLLNFLDSATPDVPSGMPEMFWKGPCHVVTKILKSDSYSVIAYDSDDVAIGLSANLLTSMASANIKEKYFDDITKKLTFKGDRSLPFAQQSLHLWVEGNPGKFNTEVKLVSTGGMDIWPLLKTLFAKRKGRGAGRTISADAGPLGRAMGVPMVLSYGTGSAGGSTGRPESTGAGLLDEVTEQNIEFTAIAPGQLLNYARGNDQ